MYIQRHKVNHELQEHYFLTFLHDIFSKKELNEVKNRYHRFWDFYCNVHDIQHPFVKMTSFFLKLAGNRIKHPKFQWNNIHCKSFIM